LLKHGTILSCLFLYIFSITYYNKDRETFLTSRNPVAGKTELHSELSKTTTERFIFVKSGYAYWVHRLLFKGYPNKNTLSEKHS
jgi:hypothetical protein